MIANAYARALDENRQLVVPANQMGHVSYFANNIFRKIDLFVNHPDDVNSNEVTVYSGYFQNETYFDKYSEAVKSLFSPTKEFMDRITASFPYIHDTTITAISVRRGDYLIYPNYHPVVTKEYIEKALQLVPKTNYYFIFTDDFQWCKENINLRNVLYIEYPSHEQLWVMSLCDHFVISNSSFSWWGAYLSRNKDKKVIAPETWFGPEFDGTWDNMYCKDWTILPTYFDNGKILPK